MELSKQKKVLISILLLLIITRLMIFLTGYLSAISFETQSPIFNVLHSMAEEKINPESLLDYIKDYEPPSRTSFSKSLNMFFKWDSIWYRQIVEEGYSYESGGDEKSIVVFFPLYPLIVKVVSMILPFININLIGFLVSNIALFFACLYLYKLTKLEFKSEETALKTVLFLLIAPFSFFFSIFYTEGLFLFLSISCFYYTRKKQWLAASVLGFFLSLTRSVGFLIFIPMLMEYLELDFNSFKIKKEKVKKDILYLLLVPAGLLSYGLYLYAKFKDPLAYFHASAKWGRELAPFFITFCLELGKLDLYYIIIAVGSIIFTLSMIIYIYISGTKLSYTIYSALLFAFPLSTTLAASIPRYLSVIFPIYFSMALITKKSKNLAFILTIVSAMLLSLMTVIFISAWLT